MVHTCTKNKQKDGQNGKEIKKGILEEEETTVCVSVDVVCCMVNHDGA